MLNNKIIISDTSCLIALANINKLDILQKTFENIVITPNVKSEYEEKGSAIPSWLTVKEPQNKEWVERLKILFGKGEAESIVLAKEEENSILILDDLQARNYALGMGIKIMGTLGVINDARKKNIVNFDEAVKIITLIKQNDFRVSDNIVSDFIDHMKTNNVIKSE